MRESLSGGEGVCEGGWCVCACVCVCVCVFGLVCVHVCVHVLMIGYMDGLIFYLSALYSFFVHQFNYFFIDLFIDV